jgi:hypothetical protein
VIQSVVAEPDDRALPLAAAFFTRFMSARKVLPVNVSSELFAIATLSAL